jgi:hypothetical protein
MYAILITIPLDAIAHVAFLLWLWYRLTYHDQPLMIEYPTAIASAPAYSLSDSESMSVANGKDTGSIT